MRRPTSFPRLLLILLAINSIGESSDGPERWEEEVDAFEARDRVSPPPENALLFVGSSSIRKWDLGESWPDTPTINNGFGGSTLADAIHYFDRLFIPYDPRAIILYAGDNDIARGLSASDVANDFEKLAGRIRDAFPSTPVVFVSIKPSRDRWNLWEKMKAANSLIAEHCRVRDGFLYADIAKPMLAGGDGAPPPQWFVADGLHLSASGYRRWTEVIRKHLEAAGALP